MHDVRSPRARTCFPAARRRRPSAASGAMAALLLLVVAGAACASRDSGRDASAGDAGASGTDGARSADRPPRPTTCQNIRDCLYWCGKEDRACAEYCVSSAPMAAQTNYRAVQTCSDKQCAADDEDCRCMHECFNDGACFDVVDTCDDGLSDLICNELCH